MNRYICIHGHFYQPPRENAWLEEIEFQDSAYPYHDWNERITAECYAPNASSRILDSEGKIIDIVNIYSKISFNFGPSILSWMEHHNPSVYHAILDADRLSMKRFSGHGSAVAQAYNHMIMPLASRRDKYTQVIWGIRDFEKRFRRRPEGMWLPETAVDFETLEVMANHGISFTILSPRQAKRIRRVEEADRWQDVSRERIDPTRAYLCLLPSGRSISIFFYDGATSREVAFNGLLNNGEEFARRLLSQFRGDRSWPQIEHIATDGETFGHHHRFGDMALAYALNYIESKNLARLTNYSEYLAENPPDHVVDIYENSSWSCVHGIERWRDNCGCNTGSHPQWNQSWRKPLRQALDWMRDQIVPMFSSRASQYLADPWQARNEYIDVILDRSHENVSTFLKQHAVRALSREEQITVIKLLEIQRYAMLMYTSCGWFFDEVSGIETTQILQYAAKAAQYAEEFFDDSPEQKFIELLRDAPSNIFKNAAEPYEKYIQPFRVDLLRVGAHYCISSVFEEYPKEIKIFCYTAESEIYEKREAGKIKFIAGKATIRSEITWDEQQISFAVLHLGDHNINAGVKDIRQENNFSRFQHESTEAFERGDIPQIVRIMDRHFSNIYSLWHLFRDEQRKVLNEILQLTYETIETSYRQIYENYYPIMSFYNSLRHRIPRPLLSAAEYIVDTDLNRCFEEEDIDLEKLRKVIDEIRRLSLNVDKTTLGFNVSAWVNSRMESLMREAEDLHTLSLIHGTLEAVSPLSLPLNLWNAQNIYFSIGMNYLKYMKTKSAGGNALARNWVESFSHLGFYLHVKI